MHEHHDLKLIHFKDFFIRKFQKLHNNSFSSFHLLKCYENFEFQTFIFLITFSFCDQGF